MSDATTATATSSTTTQGGDTTATTAATTTPPADTSTTQTTTATTAADTTQATTTAETKPAETTQGAPEAYTDFTLPEGVEADPKLLDGFKATAKELGLPQEGAQKVVSLYAEHQAAQFRETVKAWGEQAQADKEIGGDKFAENLAVSKKALEQFATPEFRAFLDKTGLGNHPEMLRTFYRAGKAISEDGFVPGRQGGNAGASIAQRMYPNMNP